jgi:hypothetical protein
MTAHMSPSPWTWTTNTTNSAICPDLLSIRDLGEADSWRGHLVRGLFRLLRIITGI